MRYLELLLFFASDSIIDLHLPVYAIDNEEAHVDLSHWPQDQSIRRTPGASHVF